MNVYSWAEPALSSALFGSDPNTAIDGLTLHITSGVHNGVYSGKAMAEARDAHDDVFVSYAAGFLSDRIGDLVNLDPYVAANSYRSEFYNRLLDRFRTDGHLYYLPLSLKPQAVFYNRDLFAARGLAEPKPDWTWDDFVGIAKRLSATRNGQRVFGAVARPVLWMYMALGAGDPLTLDDKTYRRVLELQKRMRDEVILYTGKSNWQLLRNGRSGMSVGPQFNTGWVDGTADSVPNLGVLPVPRLDADHAAETFAGIVSIAILGTSRQPELAWRTVRQLTGSAVAATIAQAGWLPANLTPDVAQAWLGYWHARRQGIHGLQNLLDIQPVLVPQNELETWWAQIGSIGNRYLAGRMSLNLALSQIGSVKQKLLEDRRASQADQGP
ncbi:MAG TPA: extracellular solute-binding protein [Limnochordia bacterium]|nr:extracellular solute-binding protein [Limnochordia bacterium]